MSFIINMESSAINRVNPNLAARVSPARCLTTVHLTKLPNFAISLDSSIFLSAFPAAIPNPPSVFTWNMTFAGSRAPSKVFF